MRPQAQSLHILFFPHMAPGHMIPMVDLAKLFALHGVKTTIVTTSGNAIFIRGSIDLANESYHHPIGLVLLDFPSAAAGMPEGYENVISIPSPEMWVKFTKALELLRQPFDRILRELLPDCIVTDLFLPWTVDAASELGIPRLVFHGTGFISLCASESMLQYKPHEGLPSDVDFFVVPGLPHRIEMLKTQIPDVRKFGPDTVDLFKRAKDSEGKSYGVVVNSFYELEPNYAEHYRKVVGRRAWAVGPVSLCNEGVAGMSERGGKASIAQDKCLNWLQSKEPGSVVYVCFGSMARFTAAQLHEIALSLEASRAPFVWVVKKNDDEPEWLPDTYEKRIEGKGLIIRGWAPQILILNHPSVGGFLTHCGWNSSLESISAGVPMITWPLFAEQFYNERLIVDVLRIGVAIGIKHIAIRYVCSASVEAAEIERAVVRVMRGGEETQAMRKRVRELREMAKRAVEEGGSSYTDMGNLIQELIERRNTVKVSEKP